MARRRRGGIFKKMFGASRRKRAPNAVARRAKNAPAHCKSGLSVCMRAKRGPGKCMRDFHSCIG